MGACNSQSDRHEPSDIAQREGLDLDLKAASQDEIVKSAKEESPVADQKELLVEDTDVKPEASAQEEVPASVDEGPAKAPEAQPAVSAIDSVELPSDGIEERDGHTYFKVLVKRAGNGASWTVNRHYHYSEFHELHKSMKNTSSEAAFPRKHMRKCTGEKLESRREGLEAWLNEVIGAHKTQEFLQPPRASPIASESSTHEMSDTHLQAAAAKLKKAKTVEKKMLSTEKPDASQITAAAGKLKPTATTEKNSLSTEKPDASQIAAAVGKLKAAKTTERISLPTKEDIEAEKKA